MMKNIWRALTNTLFIFGVIILTISGFFAYWQVQDLIKSHNLVIHTHKVIETTGLTALTLTEAESRLNFYALTNDRSVVQNISELTEIANENLLLLKKLTEDNPIQSVRVKELTSLSQQKISLFKKLTSIPDIEQDPTALALVKGVERQTIKKNIAQIVHDLTEEENNLLEQRSAISEKKIRLSHLTYLIFGMFSEIFIIGSFIFLNYNLYQRKLLQKKQDETEAQLIVSNQLLRESEERFLLATEGSAVGLWDWQVGTDNVFYSSFFRKILGYSEEEFPNSLQSFEKIIHPNDHDHLWYVIAQHLEKKIPFKAQYRLCAKSGEYIWVEASGQALWDKDGNPTRMSGSIIDISERKKNTQKINIQYATTQILSEASSFEDTLKIIQKICEELGWSYGAIWLVDESINKLRCIGSWHIPSVLLQEFRADNTKRQYAKGSGLLGKAWETGKPTWVHDINKDTNFIRSEIKNYGLVSAFAFPIKLKKEVFAVIECLSTEKASLNQEILNLMMMVSSQISLFLRRKEAEKELRESEAYQSAIFEAASDSIITIDEEETIISINQHAIKEFGYTQQELKKIKPIISDFNIKEIQKKNKYTFETFGETKDHKRIPIEINISKTKIDNQTFFVIIIRNISERKKIDKLKNEFISVVSHELRTPLTAIRGSLGLIVGGAVGEFSVKAKKLLDLANNNCERLLLLINDILDIEKIEAGKMDFDFKIIDLNQLISECTATNKMFAEKFGVSINLLKNEEIIKVKVDSGRLCQILTNLISNAVKFSPQGETVTVSVSKEKNCVRVSVHNKGEGIPYDFQPKIFQKFSQADASNTRGKGGTGLGLNISKTLVERMGGSLNFVSTPGKLTTFYFDLPIYEELESPKYQKDLVAPDKKKLLICEDDENQALYLSTLLTSSGFLVDIANTVADAKKFIEKNNYHALLLDLILPDQDGVAFIRELKKNTHTRDLPIIVISVIAQTGKSLLNENIFTVEEWLEKPIEYTKLLVAIQKIREHTHPNIPNILHIEDDPEIVKLVKTLLDKEARISSASTIKESIEKLETNLFDLVILDLFLPDGNGTELLPMLTKYDLPVIVYSSFELDTNKFKVLHTLLKSKTSNAELLSIIKRALETSH